MVGSTTSNSLVLRFESPASKLALVIEDDDRVAYAYLLEGDEIVADVWLYNVEETPESVNWRDRSRMPFLNPRRFCRDIECPRIAADSHVNCQWTDGGVEVSVEGVLMAKLERGSKPGWSRLAAIRGPLAKPLEL